MKTPKKKEVVKHFENAKEVACLYDKEPHDISKYDFSISKFGKDWWLDTPEYCRTNIHLYEHGHGYAKILSHKKPKEKTYKIKQETVMDSITINDVKYIKEDKDSYKITREQIMSLKNTLIKEDVDELLKTIFPEVVETKLTVGKWYKFRSGTLALYQGKNKESYGFHSSGKYFDKHFWFADYNSIGIEREATEQEVEEALTKEAVKRGYKNGNYNCLFLPNLTHKVVENFHYRKEDDTLYQGENPDSKNNAVYSKGKWASVIPTLTIQEAEAKLNCKII